MFDQLIVVRFYGELVILHDGSLPQNIFALSGESLPVVFGIDLLVIMEMLCINEPCFVDDVLLGDSVAAEGRHEDVRVMIGGKVVRRQGDSVALVLLVTLLESKHQFSIFNLHKEGQIFVVRDALAE